MGEVPAATVVGLPPAVPSSVGDADGFLEGWRRGLEHNQANPLRLETLDELALLLHMARATNR